MGICAASTNLIVHHNLFCTGVLINIIPVVVVVALEVIVVFLMGEFCEGLWLRPLSQDLIVPRWWRPPHPGRRGTPEECSTAQR